MSKKNTVIISDAAARALVGEPLLTVEQVALKLSCSVSRLNKQRLEGKGPAFVKDGANIRYRPIDVEAYIADRLCNSTSEQPPAA